ncbi:glycine--tRNA ligase subunit beta [Yoonia sp.]|uniref:glycine--tRNA ligase subunit beta n=1 Tax=Yoonia sp. TaxID=2212373 RepID=UPI0025FC2E5B|nr:glycine--tRNA ligase subunit beta [Yoonia sp.]
MPDLLIELFSEEIPARMQTRAADDLRKLVTDGLVEAGLTYAGAAAFSTPRRLTLSLDGLSAESAVFKEEKKGPPVDANPKAVQGFLRGLGLEGTDSWYASQIDALKNGEVLNFDSSFVTTQELKGKRVLFATLEYPPRPAADIIAEVLENAIRNFPWPKSMRWGSGTLKWVRPLHTILCILIDEAGAEVVPLDIDGITSGNTTRGHRFLAPDVFSVTSFDDYEVKLKRAKVVLRADERAEAIWSDATTQAFALGLEVVEDRGLLAEVAGLVEWPVVLLGRIGDDFLGLPPEVLQTSMKEHQKFFSVRNPKTNRIERFVTVANMETADQGATILAGNQKVLAARLADAKFFWENDLRVAKAGMDPWLDSLANVTFHNKLGSQKDRIERIAALAREIAPSVGADPDLAEQAARVAKADLSSEMVYEFPELQGLMGRYYATEAGLPAEVAAACEEHYSPLGPSDDVPTAPVSVAVALADKIDTLTGFWAIDEKPTGSKDPFALRRAVLGIIRLITGGDHRLQSFHSHLMALIADHLGYSDQEVEQLKELMTQLENVSDIASELSSNRLTPEKAKYLTDQLRSEVGRKKGEAQVLGEQIATKLQTADQMASDLLSFFHDRLKVFLKDKGIRHDIIDACIAMPGNDDLTLLVKRAEALAATLATDDGENLLQGFKRANNILTQAEEKDGVEYSYGADLKFAEDPSEKALFEALDAADAKIAPAMANEDFSTAMTAMAALRGPIDAFFNTVQVNDERQVVRRNRLNLLSRIRKICLSVADLNKIEG